MFDTATPTKIILISRDPLECPPCGANARYFEKYGIEDKYEVEKIDGNALSDEQREWLRKKGLAQTPVLFTPLPAPKDAVGGFRPDVSQDLAAYAKRRDEESVERGAA